MSKRPLTIGGRRLVLIEWEDSTQPQGRWQWLSQIQLPIVVRCFSVGFLIRDDKDVKTLAPNLGNVDCGDDLQANGLISIPTRAIVRVTPVPGMSAIARRFATREPEE